MHCRIQAVWKKFVRWGRGKWGQTRCNPRAQTHYFTMRPGLLSSSRLSYDTHHVEFMISLGAANVSSDVRGIHTDGCRVSTNSSEERKNTITKSTKMFTYGLIREPLFRVLNAAFVNFDKPLASITPQHQNY